MGIYDNGIGDFFLEHEPCLFENGMVIGPESSNLKKIEHYKTIAKYEL